MSRIRTRHAVRLGRDLLGHTVRNRTLWLVPITLAAALAVVLTITGQAVAPYAIYPLF